MFSHIQVPKGKIEIVASTVEGGAYLAAWADTLNEAIEAAQRLAVEHQGNSEIRGYTVAYGRRPWYPTREFVARSALEEFLRVC
jgi:hypothetical protein